MSKGVDSGKSQKRALARKKGEDDAEYAERRQKNIQKGIRFREEQEAQRAEAAKKRRYERIQTAADLKNLNTDEFRIMRRQQFYEMEENCSDPYFYRQEHMLIYLHKYKKLSQKKPVCPQRPLDFVYMRSKSYFEDALWVTGKLGLHHLMEFQENYSVKMVHQFFATVVFHEGETIPFTWMSGNLKCHSDFHHFAEVMGYPFEGLSTPLGLRVHDLNRVEYDKSPLKPLYKPNCGAIIGKAHDLKAPMPLLLRIFRECIYPQAGNLDDIRGALVNLMAQAYAVFRKGPEAPPTPLDVMYFMYQEFNVNIAEQKTPTYAPYVMRFLRSYFAKQNLRQPNLFAAQNVEHKMLKLVRKNSPTAQAPRGYGTPEHDTEDEIDAMEEGLPPRRGPRTKNASQPLMPPHSPAIVQHEVKKASFMQRLLLGCCVDLRHGQHDAYKRDRQLMKAIKRNNPNPDPAPSGSAPSRTLSYNEWAQGSVNWANLEDTASSSAPHGKGPAQEEDIPDAETSNDDESSPEHPEHNFDVSNDEEDSEDGGDEDSEESG